MNNTQIIKTKKSGPSITVFANGEYIGIIDRAASNKWIADTGTARQFHTTRKAAIDWIAWKVAR